MSTAVIPVVIMAFIPLLLGFQGKNGNCSYYGGGYVDDNPCIPCRIESENRIVNDGYNHENRCPCPSR